MVSKTSACIIPIKKYSSRLPGKNFKLLGDKPLYKWLIESIIEANCFTDIYLDSDSQTIKDYAKKLNIGFILRLPELAQGDAGGNDLIRHYRKIIPDYGYYFQCHVTSPFLSYKSIRSCHKLLTMDDVYDSVLTGKRENKFYWFNDQPVNYRPNILPRTQDLKSVIWETSGLYGITAKAFDRYNCRIGARPFIFAVNDIEAVDIDTQQDFDYAEYIANRRKKD